MCNLPVYPSLLYPPMNHLSIHPSSSIHPSIRHLPIKVSSIYPYIICPFIHHLFFNHFYIYIKFVSFVCLGRFDFPRDMFNYLTETSLFPVQWVLVKRWPALDAFITWNRFNALTSLRQVLPFMWPPAYSPDQLGSIPAPEILLQLLSPFCVPST